MSYDVLRFDVARLADRVAHTEGRIEALHTRLAAGDLRGEKLLALVGNVLEHAGSLQTEVLSALSRNEEQLVATRRAVEEMARTQGDLMRQLAELRK
jgi:hypothetical protein